jgi:hypothetical protein
VLSVDFHRDIRYACLAAAVTRLIHYEVARRSPQMCDRRGFDRNFHPGIRYRKIMQSAKNRGRLIGNELRMLKLPKGNGQIKSNQIKLDSFFPVS